MIEWLQRLGIENELAPFAQEVEHLVGEHYQCSDCQLWVFNNSLLESTLEPHFFRPSHDENLQMLADEPTKAFVHQEIRQWVGAQDWHLAFPISAYGRGSGLIQLSFPLDDAPELNGEDEIQLQLMSEFLGLQLEALQTRRSVDFLRQLSFLAIAHNFPLQLPALLKLAGGLAEFVQLPAKARRNLNSAIHLSKIAYLWPQSSANGHQTYDQMLALVQSVPLFKEIVPYLRHRQERFDGSGPLGKKGSELPIEIWILILAEAFEEFRQANRGLDLEKQFQSFFEEHSSGHHPTALEALGLLLVSSRLAELTAP